MALDEAAVERAAAGLRLKLPRNAPRGKLGEIRANSVGSSMEFHDFRLYQPGDDLRHIDWNAVARTGEVFLRVRQEEVSPRFELVLDASKSMAVSWQKSARAREVALWLCILAARAGLQTALIVAGSGHQATPDARACLRNIELDGRDAFDLALRRAPPLRPCGVRVVVSDLLFEAPAVALAKRLARGASRLWFVQVLDREDWDPRPGSAARLVDAESDECLDRVLSSNVINDYKQRFEAHQSAWREAAQRVLAQLITVSADQDLPTQARGALASMTEAG